MCAIDIESLRQWIGRSRQVTDDVTEGLVDRFRATFGQQLASLDGAPLGVHWCLAPHAAPAGEIGDDGHPKKGDFLPPVPLPARMWAGGELLFHNPLKTGDRVLRRETVLDVVLKQGSRGDLVFVKVLRENIVGDRLAVTDTQDIVYRGYAPAPAPSSPPFPASPLGRSADAVMLFRYSALTFNAHRIHYDQDYATQVEGYPERVVQGPLQATLLMNHAATLKGAPLDRFAYRGLAPLFANAPFTIEADQDEVWIKNGWGKVTMKASYL